MSSKDSLILMQKNIRLWEVLTAFAALCTGFGIIIWNIYTMVIEDRKDINYNSIKIDKIEKTLEDYRGDVKEINNNIQTIRIIIENKADRKND